MVTITFSGINARSALPTEVVNLLNLHAGIRAFLDQGFDSDFHNSMYLRLHTLHKRNRLTWYAIVDELVEWGAHRPRSKDWLYNRGEEYFPRLTAELARLRSLNGGRDPDLTSADPESLRPLFEIAEWVKPTSTHSPMFASKLCHFLMPSAYPIWDWKNIGDYWGSDYWAYWKRCAEGWKTADQEALKAELRKHIPETPVPHYPWGTKIGELCHIGAARLSK